MGLSFRVRENLLSMQYAIFFKKLPPKLGAYARRGRGGKRAQSSLFSGIAIFEAIINGAPTPNVPSGPGSSQ
jgi:hypothetical protein